MLTSDKIHYIIAKQVTERTTNKPPVTSTIWNLSSAGRASALQAEGHRFEPYRFHILKKMARELSWLEHTVHTRGVEGSNPPLAT